MHYWQQAVAEFHNAVGHPVNTEPTPLAPKVAINRQKLILEEVTELLRGIMDKDMVAIADGMVDTLYVTLGTAVAAGLDMSQAITLYEHSTRGPVSLLTPKHQYKRSQMLWLSAGNVLAALVYTNLGELEMSLQGLVFDVLITANMMGLDLHPLFEAVHLNNMLKAQNKVAGDTKVPKPANHQPPPIMRLLEEQGYISKVYTDTPSFC